MYERFSGVVENNKVLILPSLQYFRKDYCLAEPSVSEIRTPVHGGHRCNAPAGKVITVRQNF